MHIFALGELIQFSEHICFKGWFNHQLAFVCIWEWESHASPIQSFLQGFFVENVIIFVWGSMNTTTLCILKKAGP